VKRLVLFDIDETMLNSAGAGRRALGRALSQIFGVPEDLSQVKMSGKTDPQICREILSAAEIADEHIEKHLPQVWSIYPDFLQEEVAQSSGYTLLEGVSELLESLNDKPAISLGLLTGNIEPGARIKLERFQLNKYFRIGAYGSDSADRMQLPAVAAQRANEVFATSFEPKQIVIIGDAVNDVKCAQGFGAVSIAVNTGKTTRAELEALQPDYLFASLSETKKVLKAILP